MRLDAVTIENFRCYREPIHVDMSDLTTVVGKNDIGKSSVLEALEIFFNNDGVKIDQQDACIFSENKLVNITCDFSEIPKDLVLDAGATTALNEEYLLMEDGRLRVRKSYDCSKKTPSCEVFIVAHHPTTKGFDNLLDLKESELQKLVKAATLPILCETTAAVQPTDGPLDNPTLGQDDELAGVRTLDDLEIDLAAGLAQPSLEFRPRVAAVGIQLQQEWKQAEQRRHDQHAAVAVLHVRRVDDAVHQQALCVDEEMPLFALDLLPGIETMRVRDPPFSALLTLWLSIMAAVGLASRPTSSRH